MGLFHMDPASPKPKYYCLMMFPYPSGELHVGHGRNYIIGDVVVRYKLMKGFNVLSPMGWDAFGLPAENYAIRHNLHPAVSTRGNIENMKRQLRTWGAGYDWDREIASCEPEYYKWTQWIFLKLYEKGLAYKKMAPVNWCPNDATVLANEQVIDGQCERCGTPVEIRDLEQWFFKITAYAERLLNDLELLKAWPDRVIAMQRNWIGRSEGARVDFRIHETGDPLPCFTTRPDTLFGVTYMAIAPEHPLLDTLITGTEREAEIRDFIKRARFQSVIQRTAEDTEKEGVFTGKHVVNPVNGDVVPLWVANYALMEYGTGAVMAVPAHDQRDFEFAKKYGIPIVVVIQPAGEELRAGEMDCAYVDEGVMVHSGPFDGMSNREGIPAITRWLGEKGIGAGTVNYRLRDWLISRQRYWGAPIPIVYCPGCGMVPVSEADLPVRLPYEVEFKPTGESPLAQVEEFVRTSCPRCGGEARRETDTMDTFVCSSWYFFRYLSPKDEDRAFDSGLVNRWFPVDQYVGGIEHATGHLVYSRFITKVLHDLGRVGFTEPFQALFTQGMICKEAYWCPNHNWVPHGEVEEGRHVPCGAAVRCEMAKMSKTKLNTVSPTELIKRYGTDTQRLYTLFVGPPAKDAEWNEQGVVGCHKFLRRLWDLVIANAERLSGIPARVPDPDSLSREARDLHRKTHETIRKVTDDIEGAFGFNTAIAGIMELVNRIRSMGELEGASETDLPAVKEAVENTILLLSPFVPHFAEELWVKLGHEPGIFRQPWPAYSEDATVRDELQAVIQVNGKVRGRLVVGADLSDEEVVEAAKTHPGALRHIGSRPVRKAIVVKDKKKFLVNLVV
jgi:leucyl-tRNA synthetase